MIVTAQVCLSFQTKESELMELYDSNCSGMPLISNNFKGGTKTQFSRHLISEEYINLLLQSSDGFSAARQNLLRAFYSAWRRSRGKATSSSTRKTNKLICILSWTNSRAITTSTPPCMEWDPKDVARYDINGRECYMASSNRCLISVLLQGFFGCFNTPSTKIK